MKLPVQSLWIGDRLSRLEQLCIRSFLRHGHSFHLYVFKPPQGIPPGTEVRDAGEILPPSRIFQYTEYATYAGFANFFRYKLLLERGGWWVDMDMVCQRPFLVSSEYVISSEILDGGPFPNVGAIKVPPGSPLMEYMWNRCQQYDVAKLKWGESGPLLFAQAIEKFSLERFVRRPETFCPIAPPDWESVLKPWVRHRFVETPYAIHFWNELWRRAGRDKDAQYSRWCLYERLQRENGMFPSGNLRTEIVGSLRMLAIGKASSG